MIIQQRDSTSNRNDDVSETNTSVLFLYIDKVEKKRNPTPPHVYIKSKLLGVEKRITYISPSVLCDPNKSIYPPSDLHILSVKYIK